MELQVIQSKIYEIRGQRVMLDFDLSSLYQVETRVLKQSVKRNIERFPPDFMFELTRDEWHELITNCDNLPESMKFSPATPFAFTEQGVAMLSGVLRSKLAIEININIMRAFVSIRQYVLANYEKNAEIAELRERITALEHKENKAFAMISQVGEETLEAINDLSEDTRKELDDIYIALSELADKEKAKSKPRKPIGFKSYDK